MKQHKHLTASLMAFALGVSILLSACGSDTETKVSRPSTEDSVIDALVKSGLTIDEFSKKTGIIFTYDDSANFESSNRNRGAIAKGNGNYQTMGGCETNPPLPYVCMTNKYKGRTCKAVPVSVCPKS